MVKINRPVGQDAGPTGNQRADVIAVQKLLNACIRTITPLRLLKEDGKIGPMTINAISTFQQRVVRLARPDGRVDPGGKTLDHLNRTAGPAGASTGAGGAFAPRAKTFKQRLDALIADIRSTHKMTMRIDPGRTVEWQQKHHVAHMFLYNKYKSHKPANVESGKRTIAWSHLSDPKVRWERVDWKDFLRTKANEVPVLEGTKWKAGHEPEEAATRTNAKAIQKAGGIGSGGAAMVSSGLKPCGEPCKCSAGRSKHLDSKAADLNTTDLATLGTKLKAAKAGSIDDYLKKFGLHRPLLHHPKSPESWHVEALPDAKL